MAIERIPTPKNKISKGNCMKRNKSKMNVTEAIPAKSKKRHSILAVILIALFLMFGGSFFGGLLMILLQVIFSNQSSDVQFVISTYFLFIGIDIFVLAYCALCEKDILKSMCSAKKGGLSGNTGNMFLGGLILGFVSNGFCVLVAWINKDLTFDYNVFSPVYFLFALTNVLIQAGAEELLSRGYMQGALMERYSFKTAVIVNGLFFGLMHLPNDGVTVLSIVNTTIYGIVMSMITYYFHSLWFSIAHHTAWNFTQNFIFGLPNSGLAAEKAIFKLTGSRHSIIYNSKFGVEGGIVIFILGLISIIAILIWSKKNTNACQENNT